MKVLVTGGAGFIGSHIAETLLKKGYSVSILDNLSTGKLENIPNGADFVKGSITNIFDIENAMKGADFVIHTAAMVSVPLSFERKEECFKINIDGTKNILEASLKAGIKKVVFSSSAAVYGNNPNFPLKEDEPYAFLSPYAESKVEGEKLCQEYEKKGLKTCSLRYFNVYGPRQDPKSPYSGVISIFSDKAKINEDIVIFGDGLQTRDFVNVKDVADANILAMEKLTGIYNVATGNEITIKELAEKIIQIRESKSKITFREKRQGDIEKSLADIEKIKREGFLPRVKLEDGLKEI